MAPKDGRCHPELSPRKSIYVNAQILLMQKISIGLAVEISD